MDQKPNTAESTKPRRRWLQFRLRAAYVAVLIIGAAAAWLTTFRYEYFLNENTRAWGWPVPIVIWQRDNAESPWLDFVGPTSILAYPMNLAIFMVIPSAVFLIVVFRQRRAVAKRKQTEQAAL